MFGDTFILLCLIAYFPLLFSVHFQFEDELKTSSHNILPRVLFGPDQCRQILAGYSITPWNSFCSGRKHGAIKFRGSLKLRRSLGDRRASGSHRREPRLTCMLVACLSLSILSTCSCCALSSQRDAKGWVRGLRGLAWQKSAARTLLSPPLPERAAAAEIIWCVCCFFL